MGKLLPKLNAKEQAVVDEYVEKLEKQYKDNYERLLKKNQDLEKRNEILTNKILRRGLDE